MKKTIAFVVTAALALSAAHASAAEKKKLAFIVNAASDFWKLAEAGVKKAQGELPNYELQFKYPAQGTAALQNALMDDLVAAGTNAIMISSVDPKTSIDAFNRIAAAGAALYDRQRRAGEQPNRLSGIVEHAGRRAGRRNRGQGAAEGRQVHGLRRLPRRRQRQGAHRRLPQGRRRQGHYACRRARRRRRLRQGAQQCRRRAGRQP